jgi:subtilisin
VRIGRIPTPCPITRSWAFGTASGAGVRVCLIDSGVDVTHPDVGGVVTLRVDSGGDNDSGDNDSGGGGEHRVVPDEAGDVAGHGTACAGIIRALAPTCELTSIRLLGGSLRGRGDALVASLRWAIERRFHLVNLSLSTRHPDYREAIRDVADQAYFDGVTIVAAANNRPVASFPWRFPSVVSAGSHAVPDPEYVEVNPTPPVDFFALGVNVTVAQPAGGRVRASGNSFAAPHITGMCARILGAHPEFGAPQLKVVLAAIANNLS